MKYILPAFLLIISTRCFCQTKKYLYYFDKDLNSADQSHALFYGTGEYENGLIKLMLYNNKDKHLIMIEHFTDSTLQLNDGLFSSYYTNAVKESEGNYTSGKQDGLWERWDSSGNIIDSSFFNNGEPVMNTTYEYFPDKKIQRIIFNDLVNHKFRRTSYDESNHIIKTDTTEEDDDKVFTKTEIEASFPGGPAAWVKYIQRNIEEHNDEFTNNDYGTCNVRFIVNKTGKVLNVQALTMKGSRLADIVVRAIENGPNWTPAQQNGRYVNSFKIQPVTITNPN